MSTTTVRLDPHELVGVILARSGTTDIVDVHLVAVAIECAEPILTGDVGDMDIIVASLPTDRPSIHHWP